GPLADPLQNRGAERDVSRLAREPRVEEYRAEVDGPAARPRERRAAERIELAQTLEPRVRALEQHPRRGEIGRAIAARHVAPVEHAGERAVPHEDVAGVQITVDPGRRGVERRLERRRPRAADRARHELRLARDALPALVERGG